MRRKELIIGGGSGLFAAANEVPKAIHVEGKGETEGLVKRGGLSRGEHIGGVEAYYVEGEAGTETEVLAVAFILAFVVIACAEEELLVIVVLSSQGVADFAEFLLEATGRIGKRFENTGDGRYGLPVVEGFGVGRFIDLSVVIPIVVAAWARGDKEFVQVEADSKIMVIGQGEHE